MAQIIEKQGRRGLPQSIIIDFTPMVDLGFLLVTFFMLTTTMIKQHELTISVPPNDAVISAVKNPPTIVNIVLEQNGMSYFLNTDSLNKIVLPVSNKELSNKLSQINNELLDESKSELAIILIPDATAPLHQVINCIDAIHKAKIEKYCFK